MLPLLERVVGHLERVRRVANKEVVDRGVRPDFDRFERFVIELFERNADRDRNLAVRLDKYHWRWEPTYLRAFVVEMHWRLLDGVGAQWSTSERAGFIEMGLGYASRLLDPRRDEGLSMPRARMVDAMVHALDVSIGEEPGTVWDSRMLWRVAEDYCEQVGLSLATEGGTAVTPAGATAMRLRGRDRVRWLLALETSLATSSSDPWCIDLESVCNLARGSNWLVSDEQTPTSRSTFERWTELGALRHRQDSRDAFDGYVLTSLGSELFGELDRDDATSFRILARALLEDDREAVLARHAGSDSSSDRATEATLRHARLVAHEVRNALLPVQFALKKVWNSPAVKEAGLEESRHRVDDGLARLHRFIEDSLRLTPLTDEETTHFSLMDAIEEARRQCVPSPEGGILIETIPANVAPECRGHQGRFVLALLNLLRNAVQVGGRRIWISIDARASEMLTVRVRDDGPGVPEDRRETLFENGVSHRSGGSGHGLSFVRLVVEKEMEGKVQLGPPSDGQGACFELQLPYSKDAR